MNHLVSFFQSELDEARVTGFAKSLFGEFDPGSGQTLAACLIHASRTVLHVSIVADG